MAHSRRATPHAILITVVLVVQTLALGSAFAATGGPDAFGYTFRDNLSPGGPTFLWQDIASTGTFAGVQCDDCMSSALPIGFAFQFYGATYTSVFASSNGFLSFSPGQFNGCCSGQVLPNPSNPNNLVSAYWSDLLPGNGGSVKYQTLGAAPTRVFILQYTNVPFFGGSSSVRSHFQIKLFEGTNLAEVHYQNVPGSNARAGIENGAGSVGLNYRTSFPATTATAVRYSSSTLVPPITTISLSGVGGNSPWYVSNVAMSLACSPPAGSSCASTHYRIDGGPQQTYTGPVTVATPGSHTVQAWSVAASGATESPVARSFSMDLGDPSVSIGVGCALAGNAPWCRSASATYATSASDPLPGSGLSSVACRVDGVTAGCSGSLSAPGIHQVDATATDVAGRAGSRAVSIGIDAAPPVVQTNFACSQPGLSGWCRGPVTFSPFASDATSGIAAFTCALDGVNALCASSSFAAEGSHTYVATAQDGAGNSFSATVLYRIDSTPPTISQRPDLDAEATGPDGAVVSYLHPTVADAGSGPRPASCTHASGAAFALGETLVQCSATDVAGNGATMSFRIRVVDTTAPALETVEDVVAEATGPNGAVVSYDAPAANDLVDGATVATCSPPSGGVFALGETIVTCSTSDANANGAQTSFVVRIVDTTAPVVSVPADFVVEAASSSGAVATFDASAADSVSGDLAPSCSPASGSTFPLGTTLVACQASDAAGNLGSASFRVTVVDTTAPVLALPADLVVEATGPYGAIVAYVATAFDDVSGSVEPSCDVPTGAIHAIGTTLVSCTATDAAGNSVGGSFSVRVGDTTPPTIGSVEDVVLEATGASGASFAFAAPATSDAVDGGGFASCSPASGVFALGETTVTCTATDAHGNVATSVAFTVRVQDTTPPTIAAADDVVVEATGPAGAFIAFASPATSDAVDGAGEATCAPASDATFPIGSTLVACTAADAAGNAATPVGFTVTVRDTTAPVIAAVADIVREATGPTGAEVDLSAPATTDAVDGDGVASCSATTGATFALGETTVVCVATDAAGNDATPVSFRVSVVDTTPPVLAEADDVVAEATGAAGAAVAFDAPTTSDLVDGSGVATCDHASGATFALGTTLVTCVGVDAAGNAASRAFTVSVVDTTPPTLALPEGVEATATSTAGALVTYEAWASDTVDGDLAASCAPASGGWFAPGSTDVVCTATDAHGNTAEASFSVQVSYDWSGILGPGKATGSSATKAGSTIPVRFTLTGASLGIGDATARLYIARVTDGGIGAESPATSTSHASSGNLFRADDGSGKYKFELSTKGLAPGIYQLRVDLGDGNSNTGLITLR